MAEKEVIGKSDTFVSDTIINVNDTIDAWFVENFNGVLDMPTSVYNLAYKAKEKLKLKLKGDK